MAANRSMLAYITFGMVVIDLQTSKYGMYS